jgi:archaeosine-15-forming tRNA-guanine transglycosylase
MKRLLLLTAIFLTACSPSIQEEEEVAIIDEIDQLVLVEKARAQLLIKTETIKAVNNPLLP